MKDSQRRVHSTIDKLPPDLVNAVMAMGIRGQWPDDCEQTRPGKPYYADIVAYVKQKGHKAHRDAIGRFIRRQRKYEPDADATERVRQAILHADTEKTLELQRAAAELLSGHLLEYLVGAEDLSPEDMRDLAQANKVAGATAIAIDKYVQQVLADRAEKMKKSVRSIRAKRGLSPEVLREIKEKVYGIMDDHLGYQPTAAEQPTEPPVKDDSKTV